MGQSSLRSHTLGLVLGALLVLAGCSAPEPVGDALDEEAGRAPRFELDEAALEEFVLGFLEEKRIPGIAVAIVDTDGPLFSAGYGWADIEGDRPMTPETVSNIASISKTFTATAVLQLRDRGLLDLDDDVSEHVPFAVRHPLFPEEPITIRQLLTHTASVNDSEAYDESYACGDPQISLADWIRGYFEPGGAFYDAEQNFLAASPGTEASYSNMAFGLLGYLVEVLSGQVFEDYTREQIFEPLGMAETGWFLSDIAPERHATPYAWVEAGDTLDNPLFGERNGELMAEGAFVPFCPYSFYNLPDGLVRTSVDQLARFLVANMRGGEIGDRRILDQETLAEALSPQLAPEMIESGRYDQGLAWRLRRDEAGDFWAHSGADPGVRTRLLFSQESGIGVLVLANRAARVSEVVDRLLEEVSPPRATTP